jgi:hypothetical protein
MLALVWGITKMMDILFSSEPSVDFLTTRPRGMPMNR